MDLLYLLSIITQALWVDAEALLAHQTLAAQFQKNSFKLCHNIVLNVYCLMFTEGIRNLISPNAYERITPFLS